MFNWLQHLFTARVLQLENADLRLQLGEARKRISELELEVAELKQVVNVKDEEIARLKNRSGYFREVNVITKNPRR